jgi:hypothetical protein
MKAPLLIPLLAVGFVLVGCSDTPPTEPFERPADAEAGFDFLNGTQVPGQSHVVRFGADETWMLSTQSGEAELFTVYGDPTEAFNCGGSGNPEFSVQWNEMEYALNILALKKDFTIYVYEFFDVFPPDFCAFLADDWAYRGTVSYNEVYHDNGTNGNRSWKWTTNGAVEDQGGNPYSYHELQHLVRDANGFGGWIKEDIKVTPRGNH